MISIKENDESFMEFFCLENRAQLRQINRFYKTSMLTDSVLVTT